MTASFRGAGTAVLDNSASAVTDTVVSSRWVRPLLRFIVLMLGGLHASVGAMRYSMNPDGVAYLDIGDAYLRQDWSHAINMYWSPLYSWVLGVAMYVWHPSMRWEFPAVHAINFCIYVVALICFEFFWLRLMRDCQARSAREHEATYPEWLWLALGYSLFAYAALNLIKVWSVTPDMLVAAVVFLAAGLVVRFRTEGATRRGLGLLGAVLGLGYLAKTAMFPLAFVFLGVTSFAIGNLRRAMRLVPVAMLSLLVVAGPYVAVLSWMKGGLTFGETGRLMYAWHINHVPHPHWQGEVPGAGTPRHGSRRIFEAPRIYDIGRSFGGTYPVAYDPTYWYEGVTPHFEWRGQVKVLESSLLEYFDLFFGEQAGLIVGVLILYYLVEKGRPVPRNIVREYALAIIALLALGIYALVHVQTRYIGAFIVLLWADLLAGVRLSQSQASRKWLSFVGGVMLVIILINVVMFNLWGSGHVAGSEGLSQATQHVGPPAWPGEVAEELHRQGIRPGDKVAVIGYGFDSYWARLARVQIAAEMFDSEADPFWLGDSSVKSGVLHAFASSGAKAIVAERVPPYVNPTGWHRVGRSNYYIYVFV